MTMLIDAFTFFNELDMLEFRLWVLYPLVDKFVIVEADHTFSGKKKPFNLENNWGRFAWAHDKIIYHKMMVNPNVMKPDVAPPSQYQPDHQCWKIESIQREGIIEGCKGLPSDAIVMIGDVDEIPSRDAVVYVAKESVCAAKPIVLRQSIFYYNLRFMRKEFWHGTIATTLSMLREIGAQNMRDKRNSLELILAHSGWHMSYFGDVERIWHKVESFSHQELNTDKYKNADHIAHCIESGEDLFDRDVPLMAVGRDHFPDYFREYANKEWW